MDAAAKINLGQICFVVQGNHQVKMGVRVSASAHDLVAEAELVVGEGAGFAGTAAVKVIAEAVGVFPPIGLDIIIDDDDPDIPAGGLEGLEDKRVFQRAQGGHIIDIFHRIEQVDAKAGIFPVKFGDDFFDIEAAVSVYCGEQVMLVVDTSGMGQHLLGKEGGLDDFGAAALLSQA